MEHHYLPRVSVNVKYCGTKRVRGRPPKRPMPLTTMTYADLKRRLQTNAENGGTPGLKSLPNAYTALGAFMTQFGLRDDNVIGSTLRASYYDRREEHRRALEAAGRPTAYVRNRLSLLASCRRMVLETDRDAAASGLHASPFQQALAALFTEGRTVKGVAQALGIPRDTLRRWMSGATPQPGKLGHVKRLERHFGLPDGALSDLLPFQVRVGQTAGGNMGGSGTPADGAQAADGSGGIDYRERQSIASRQRYTLDEISSALRRQWLALLIYKTAESLVGIRRSRNGQWSLTDLPVDRQPTHAWAATIGPRYCATAAMRWTLVRSFLGWLTLPPAAAELPVDPWQQVDQLGLAGASAGAPLHGHNHPPAAGAWAVTARTPPSAHAHGASTATHPAASAHVHAAPAAKGACMDPASFGTGTALAPGPSGADIVVTVGVAANPDVTPKKTRAKPPAPTGGLGMAVAEVQSLTRLADPESLKRYVDWAQARSGGKAHEGMSTFVRFVASLTHPSTGWLTQSGVELLGTRDEAALGDWSRRCQETHAWCSAYLSSTRVTTPSRDPFKPIEPLLRHADPLVVYRDALVRLNAARPATGGMEEAVWMRDRLLMKLIVSNPLRKKNLYLMRWLADDTGEVRREEGRWVIRIPKDQFKNFKGAARDRDYCVEINESVVADLELYLKVYRPMLLRGAADPGYLFLSSERPDRPWYRLSRRYAQLTRDYVTGCAGFGVHMARHLVACTILKKASVNGSVESAWAVVAAVLHDREDTVRKHYARFGGRDVARLTSAHVKSAFEGV